MTQLKTTMATIKFNLVEALCTVVIGPWADLLVFRAFLTINTTNVIQSLKNLFK